MTNITTGESSKPKQISQIRPWTAAVWVKQVYTRFPYLLLVLKTQFSRGMTPLFHPCTGSTAVTETTIWVFFFDYLLMITLHVLVGARSSKSSYMPRVSLTTKKKKVHEWFLIVASKVQSETCDIRHPRRCRTLGVLPFGCHRFKPPPPLKYHLTLSFLSQRQLQ